MAILYKKKFINFWLIIISCALFYCYQFVIRVLPNTLSEEFMDAFGLDASGFGLLLAFYYWTYAGLQLPLGITIDRIKTRVLLPFAPLICAVAVLMFSYTDNFVIASIARLMMGVGSACGFIGAVKVASTILPKNRISVGIGVTILFGTMGASLGGQPLKMLADIYGWREVLAYLAIPGFVLSGILFLALSSIVMKIKERAADNIEKSHPLEDLKIVLGNKQIVLLALCSMFLYMPITVLGVGWGMGFLTSFYNLSYEVAAAAVALMFVGAGIGGPLSAIISEIIHSRKIVLLIAAICSLALFLLMLYTDFKLNELSIFIMFFLIGMLYSAKTLTFALAIEIVPKRVSGLATSTLNMAVMGAGVFVHPMIGYLLDYGNPETIEDYSKYDYTIALTLLPLASLLAVILIIFIQDYTEEDHLESEDRFISYED